MDNTNITLIIAKNELVVDDRTVPENYGEYVAIEFVTYADSNVALGLKICTSSECSSARILLEKDGLYYYHKLYVPNMTYVTTLDNKVGEVFVKKDVENNVYKLYQVKAAPGEGQSLIDVSEEITPAQAYDAAVKAWTGTPNQTVYIAKKPVFCI